MGESATSPAEQQALGDALQSRCHGCRITVSIRHGVVETSEGHRHEITYADPDIVVWDCPVCALANADEA